MPLTLPSVFLIDLLDPLFIGGALIAAALAVYVITTVRGHPESSPPSGQAGGGDPGDVAKAKQQFQERKQQAKQGSPGRDAREPSEKPTLGPGKGRSLAEMADHEEIDEASLLSRFVVNAQGDTVGETMALESDEVILKREGGFYAVSMDAIIEKDGMLLVDATIDWDRAKEAGDEWRKAAHDEMEYDDSGLPVVED